jgi:hypothetical protein
VVAYLIYKLRMSYQEAFDRVKKVRGVASPNIGFISQLMFFEKRISKSLDEGHLPRIICIGSHQVEDPERIVARHLFEKSFYFYVKNKNDKGKKISLDPRSIFIVMTERRCYIWIGHQCDANRSSYLSKAKMTVEQLHSYEGTPL